MQITMVGKITEVNETDVCLSLKLDDGTGTIELSYWVESNSGEEVGYPTFVLQVL